MRNRISPLSPHHASRAIQYLRPRHPLTQREKKWLVDNALQAIPYDPLVPEGIDQKFGLVR
jgi:hypothetical protein